MLQHGRLLQEQLQDHRALHMQGRSAMLSHGQLAMLSSYRVSNPIGLCVLVE